MRRRDKKVDRRKNGMRVDDSARSLAKVKEDKVKELISFYAAHDPDYLMQKMKEVFDPDLL